MQSVESRRINTIVSQSAVHNVANAVQVPTSGEAFASPDFTKPNNPLSLSPVQLPVPSSSVSLHSGGTTDILPRERARASFTVETMTNILDGGPERTKRRRFILSPSEGMTSEDKHMLSVPERLKSHLKHFVEVHDEWFGNFIPTVEDVSWMNANTMNSGTMLNHFGLFVPTILSQATPEQMGMWFERAYSLKIIGSYAQTELGHGSNVRGLQTIAEFDKTTQEFILNTPSLLAMKWWPGTLGKVGTHAIVYAQLILDGKEHGVHAFMLQIRDENHRPLPGITIGDLGPKMGDHANDTGFMILDRVRIPRNFMFMKNQEVTPEGKYIATEREINPKAHYSTMMLARAGFVSMAGGYLARAVTVAMRYSCVRQQGFVDTSTGSYKSAEKQIIDYQVQQYRIFKQLAISYAMKFSGRWLLKRQQVAKSGEDKSQDLKEIAATAAGLKGLCTYMAWEGIEDCRKCLGGNGYLMISGIASLAQDYVWQITAEGDYVLMILQLGKFLLKAFTSARQGEVLSGPCDYLAAVKDSSVDPTNSVLTSATSLSEFMSLNHLLIRFKERSLVNLADAHKTYSRNLLTHNQDAAFNGCSAETSIAVKSHCSYFLLSNFISSINDVTDKACKTVLEKVCTLFALANMCDENWNGFLDRHESVFVKQGITVLLEQLRPDAVALVDAFDIPDRVLGSALGRYDGNVYEALFQSVLKAPLNQTDPFVGFNDVLKGRLDTEFLSKRSKL